MSLRNIKMAPKHATNMGLFARPENWGSLEGMEFSRNLGVVEGPGVLVV